MGFTRLTSRASGCSLPPSKSLSVIDLKAGRQTSLIPNLDTPQAAYDAATNHLFVSLSGDGSVKMFDGKTFQPLQTIKYSADSDNLSLRRQE